MLLFVLEKTITFLIYNIIYSFLAKVSVSKTLSKSSSWGCLDIFPLLSWFILRVSGGTYWTLLVVALLVWFWLGMSSLIVACFTLSNNLLSSISGLIPAVVNWGNLSSLVSSCTSLCFLFYIVSPWFPSVFFLRFQLKLFDKSLHGWNMLQWSFFVPPFGSFSVCTLFNTRFSPYVFNTTWTSSSQNDLNSPVPPHSDIFHTSTRPHESIIDTLSYLAF